MAEELLDLLGWVASPDGIGRGRFALHKKGIGCEDRIIGHYNAIVNQRIGADAAALADPDRS